ncbi:hypothetical protein CSOJ01_06396 [Colletotrichum sojae]|uniref:Uncharacterized protein n=1 Tax=Colletotrichum sojae TaxID=2175907 RepID=A0A8H6JC46_9PEZI|nr:hypothetical protein CSOJ01_06396 [Colletotrichum sojae]
MMAEERTIQDAARPPPSCMGRSDCYPRSFRHGNEQLAFSHSAAGCAVLLFAFVSSDKSMSPVRSTVKPVAGNSAVDQTATAKIHKSKCSITGPGPRHRPTTRHYTGLMLDPDRGCLGGWLDSGAGTARATSALIASPRVLSDSERSACRDRPDLVSDQLRGSIAAGSAGRAAWREVENGSPWQKDASMGAPGGGRRQRRALQPVEKMEMCPQEALPPGTTGPAPLLVGGGRLAAPAYAVERLPLGSGGEAS